MTARVFRDAGTDVGAPGSAPEPDAPAVAGVGGVLAEGPAEAATVTGTLRLRALGIQSTDQETSGGEDGLCGCHSERRFFPRVLHVRMRIRCASSIGPAAD
jgi:hypothetical protein